MLINLKLRSLKPAEKAYKLADRDGMYVTVSPAGRVTFRFYYRFNGRRETLTLGKYGSDGISLAEARGRVVEARRLIESGISPAAEKQRDKARICDARYFETWANDWITRYKMAETTRAMRRSVLKRDVLPAFGRRKLWEVTEEDIRALCNRILNRGAPATAVHAREVIMSVFDWAILHGEKRIKNPARQVRPC